MAQKEVLVSVGDDSGDRHAANLMRAMLEAEPDLRFVGFGMEEMAQAGLVSLESEGPRDGAMWLHNLVRIRHYRRRLDLCRRRLDSGSVSLVVPVDFGGFNLCLCREAARRGVPVFYYIPPQVYAHGRYRLVKLRKWVTRCGLIYPFEEPLFREWGVPATYVGHPLFDQLERDPPSEATAAALRGRFGSRLIGLFPGSRRQEVRANLPVLAEACRRIRSRHPDAAFALRCPPHLGRAVRDLLPRDSGIEVLEDATSFELARASMLCIAKSGTVTLEIASQGTPMLIFYHASAFVCFLGYGLSHVPYMGTVNLIAGREVCPEKVMYRPAPGWLAERAIALLESKEAYEASRRAIRQTLADVARPGASARAGQAALELM